MACCSTCGSTRLPCGCCVGTEALTPAVVRNRAGQSALSYRVGTHAAFFESMKARLATMEVDGAEPPSRPLRALTTRDPADFSIALLDGWATVADVLTFYQERIANEGFLRTATERRSVLELANLVGYRPRPGVSASVYLAYTLDENQIEPTTIPAGSRSQSLPGPGETPQSFETSEDLVARREWNNLQVRLHRPQRITPKTALLIEYIMVADAVASLRPGDPLLLLFSEDGSVAAMRNVRATEGPSADGHSTIRLDRVAPDLAATIAFLVDLVAAMEPHYADADGATRRAIERARELQQMALLDHSANPADWPGDILNSADGDVAPEVFGLIATFAASVADALDAVSVPARPPLSSPDEFVRPLLQPRVPQVANSLQLRRDLGSAFATGADSAPQLLVDFAPAIADSYYAAWANANVNAAEPALVGVFVLRTSAALFGASVPRQVVYDDNGAPRPQSQWLEWELDGEQTDALFLDQLHPAIAAPGYALISKLDGSPSRVMRITEASAAQRTAYGISGKSTRLRLASDWWNANTRFDMDVLRSTLVRARSEPLTLVEEPITDDVSGDTIELAALHDDLQSGRWVILYGERADIPGVDGVKTAELMMVSGLVHGYDATLPGDTTHTTLKLATPTAYVYKRESLVIYGNVVKATHGETRNELLGNGDGGAEWQAFTLKQPPLTFVSAPTAAGAESTLTVYVDDLRWHETPSLALLGPKDRGFISRIDDDGQITVTFGNGEHGARLPTGLQNVRAVYRSGIGAAGNVRARQISMLTTRPLGVKEVINPLPASGGADRESRDLARENAPLAVKTLDRLVSLQDYADFARTFAGIGKAVGTRTSDGARSLVLLTIAGADDAPIYKDSDLYRNLLLAVRELGDPDLPVLVEPRELRALVLSAGVALLPDYTWEPVAAAVRAQLLDMFGFARRALGQSVRLCEVIAAMQAVKGVAWVDVDVFTSIPEKTTTEAGTRELITQSGISRRIAIALSGESPDAAGLAPSPLPPDVIAFPGGYDDGTLRPAELAIFTPAVPDTLILNQLS